MPLSDEEKVSKTTLIIIAVSICSGITIMVLIALILLRTRKRPRSGHLFYLRSSHRPSIVGMMKNKDLESAFCANIHSLHTAYVFSRACPSTRRRGSSPIALWDSSLPPPPHSSGPIASWGRDPHLRPPLNIHLCWPLIERLSCLLNAQINRF